MIFYIKDTTLTPLQERIFNDYPAVVNYLSTMSQRAYGQDKKQRTLLLEELGNGEDDRNSTLFVRSMSEKFEVGIIRDGRRTKCDITSIIAFQKQEYGD
jgi:hypothetical protein